MKTTITIFVLCLLVKGVSIAQERYDSLENQWRQITKDIFYVNVVFDNTSDKKLKISIAKQVKKMEKKTLLIQSLMGDEMCREILRKILGNDVAYSDDCELIRAFLDKMIYEIEKDEWLCASVIDGDCKDFLKKNAESPECESIHDELKFWISLFNNEIDMNNDVLKKQDVRIYNMKFGRYRRTIR